MQRKAPTTLEALHKADPENNNPLTATNEEMDEILQKAWDPIFRIYKNQQAPSFAPFLAEYGKWIETHPMECKPLKGADLEKVLKKKTSRACGIDGWRYEELRNLPTNLLDAWASFLNLVEETGTWPDALLAALVTMIPKDPNNTSDPLQQRPITVTSAVYRLWACARLEDVLKWQERWIHHSQYGFRRLHGIFDVIYDLLTQIEDALLGGKPLFGIALDYAKCFDRVPQELTMELVGKLGLHSRILGPLSDVYGRLERRINFKLGVGQPFNVTNGILQGCPISIILINALFSVLVKKLDSKPPCF